jgi:hypothetical protein
MPESAKKINEQIVEIRYRPNAKVLDYRGTWAEMLAEHLSLTEWQIIENRFDVFDKDNSRLGFVSYKNAGFIVHNSPTKNYFSDQANKFFRFLFDQKPFGDPLFIARVGVRSRFATEYNGSFEQLLELYSSRFLTLTPQAKTALAAKIIDLGGPIDAETALGKINSRSGPMSKQQIKEFFEFEDSPPDVAFYLDIDYWQKPECQVASKDLLATLRRYADENWDRHERIISLVLGE